MSVKLSDDTSAVLLLTAPLGSKTGGNTSLPLTWAEYMKLASYLKRRNLRPADLLTDRANGILNEDELSSQCDQVANLLERGFQLSRVAERWARRGIWVISVHDAHYPSRLKDRLGNQAPPLLYGCGDVQLLDSGGLAVVGSRNAHDNTFEYANAIGKCAAKSQCPVVSGGARGVDQAAMSGCLTSGGVVLGVLSERLERVAMSSENREALMENQLVVVSPYDPQAGFNVGNAMRRNKMIYALADAGLVVESTYGKGGTWAGAIEQLDRLQFVPVYVRSHDDRNRALRTLVSKGALVWPDPQSRGEFGKVLQEAKRLSEIRMLNVDASSQSNVAATFMDIGHGEYSAEAQTGAHSAESTEANLGPKGQYRLGMSEKHDRDPDKIAAEPFDHATLKSDSPQASAADLLFAEVERLLALLPSPVVGEAVHSHLGVGKQQATKWMTRLVEESKYVRDSRPRVSYRRIVE